MTHLILNVGNWSWWLFKTLTTSQLSAF